MAANERKNIKKIARGRRRRGVLLFFSGVLIGSSMVLAYIRLEVLPEFEKEEAKVIALKEKENRDLLAKFTELKEAKLAEIEKNKPRMTFGLENEGTAFPELSGKIEAEIIGANFIGSVLAVKDNQVVLEKAYGYADRKNNRLNEVNSEYMLASTQKYLTASLVMLLVEQDKLSLTTKLSDYYPTIPNSEEISIRSLLDMTSGLFLKGYDKAAASDADAINYVLNNVTYIPLTEKWRYSAVNYTILAGIIEQITGQSYQQFFEEQIIAKLALKHTGFYDRFKDSPFHTVAYNDKSVTPYAEENIISNALYISELGTGNVYMSVGDLFTFYQALIDGKLINNESFKQLKTHTELSFPYSYTGGVYQQAGYFTSHGIFKGYEPTISITNDGNTGVITFSNHRQLSDGYPAMTNRIFRLIK